MLFTFSGRYLRA